MPKDFSGNYFRVVTENSLDFKQFEEIVREEVRAAHEVWGNRMAAGYNKIVADWSTETRPHFQSITRYIRATKNVFVYVYIRGTQHQKMIFDNLDHGAKRGQWVSAGVGLPRTQEEEAVQASYKKAPKPINFPTKPPGQKPTAWRKDPAWLKWDKEYKKAEQQQVRSAKRKKQKPTGPGRTKKQSRLGPTPYTHRTSVSGSYRGAGYSASANPPKSRDRGATGDSKWRGRGQPKRMQLKPIKARKWSLRLRWLIKGRAWPHAEDIWGSKQTMLHTNVVAQGYKNAGIAVRKARK